MQVMDALIPPSILPQEIVDEIVDYHQDDFPTLRIIGLINRTFGMSCRRWLFHRLFLRTEKSLYPCCWSSARLYQLLCSSPSLAYFVKDISIEERSHLNANDHAAVLRELTSVDRVSLSRIGVYQSLTLPASTILPSIKIAFMAPYLTSITINDSQGLPTTLFRLCSALQHLTISASTFINPRNEGHHLEGYSKPSLRKLDLIISSMPDDYARLFDLTRLTILNAFILDFKIYLHMLGLVKFCSASLENLSLQVGGCAYPILTNTVEITKLISSR